jgi:hypothetical protein
MTEHVSTVNGASTAPSAQFAQLLGELIMRGIVVGLVVSGLLLGVTQAFQ